MPRKKKDISVTEKHEPNPEKVVDHVVTQEDLDNNPDLAKDGIKVGDTIGIPEEPTPPPFSESALEPVPSNLKPESAHQRGHQVEPKERPEPTEAIVAIHNISSNRAINQTIGGKVYSIGAGRVGEFPRSIADRILAEWPNAKIAVDERVQAPAEPWEAKMGDAFERAKVAHNIDLSKPKDTVGPKRPEVKEPPIPKDENGQPDPSANKFVCPTCVAEFPSVKMCREHQRVEHGT
jgi:hypothetical protein